MSKVAEAAAKAIVDDLRRNKRLGDVWDSFNEATHEDTIEVWARLIDDALAASEDC